MFLFRGIRFDDERQKDWAYGCLCGTESKPTIQISSGRIFRVIPESVGVYTGYCDIKGTRIFTKDIVQDKFGMEFVVTLDHEENRFTGLMFYDYLWDERQDDQRFIRNCSIAEFSLVVTGYYLNSAEFKEILELYDGDKKSNPAMKLWF